MGNLEILSYNPQLFEVAVMEDNCHFHYGYSGAPDITCSSSTHLMSP